MKYAKEENISKQLFLIKFSDDASTVDWSGLLIEYEIKDFAEVRQAQCNQMSRLNAAELVAIDFRHSPFQLPVPRTFGSQTVENTDVKKYPWVLSLTPLKCHVHLISRPRTDSTSLRLWLKLFYNIVLIVLRAKGKDSCKSRHFKQRQSYFQCVTSSLFSGTARLFPEVSKRPERVTSY